MPFIQLFIRLIITVSLISLLHFLVYDRLIMPASLPEPFSFISSILLFGSGLAFTAGIVWSSNKIGKMATKVQLVSFSWLGIFMLFVGLVLALDVIQIFLGLVLNETLFDKINGLIFRRWFLLGSILLLGGYSGYAIYHGLTQRIVRRVEVTLEKLPSAFNDYTIVQLSDLHIGPLRDNTWLSEIVAQTNALKPDLIAITGDLFEGTASKLLIEGETIAKLRAKDGVFFVTGNHEYYIDPYGWLERLPKLGMKVLENEHVQIKRGNSSFTLAGVNDPAGTMLRNNKGSDLEEALQNHDPLDEIILLAHQPAIIKKAVKHDVGLILSGHTHGGQVWPFHYFVYLQQPLLKGLHQRERTQIYISEGTGFWGPPMRAGTTAEITFITLKASMKSHE